VNEQEFAELAAGFVLDALSPHDAETFLAAREQHPEWEHHVTTDAATAALLAESVAEVEPPAGARASLLAVIAQTPQTPQTPPAPPTAAPELALETAPARRRFGARGWFALAASLALLVGVGWGAVFVSEQLSTPASVVALEQVQAAPDVQSARGTLPDGGLVTAYWSDTVGKTVLVSDGLPKIAGDQSFEMWFVRDGAPISAGTFTAEDGTATTLLAGEVELGDVIALTVEPAGGSPSGEPSSEPIVVIATA
jgi:anti-sigma-K factor RskA